MTKLLLSLVLGAASQCAYADNSTHADFNPRAFAYKNPVHSSVIDLFGTSENPADDTILRWNGKDWSPAIVHASAATKRLVVLFHTESPNEVVAIETKVRVPVKAKPYGTLFIWPGLEPGGNQHGVLQPVLTFGPSCAPGAKPALYSAWWISGQYVDADPTNPSAWKCSGGPVMAVEPGETLFISIKQQQNNWQQNISDLNSGYGVSFSVNLDGEKQNNAFFVVEEFDSEPPSAVTFFDSIVTFRDRTDCKLLINQAAVNGLTSVNNGHSCYLREITFR